MRRAVSAPPTFTITVGPAYPPDVAAGHGAAFAVALSALLLALWLARYRGRSREGPGARRLVRIAAPAFFFAIAHALGQAAYLIASAGVEPELVPAAAATAIGGLLLMLVVGFADLMLEPFRPLRRRVWLAAAASGFGVLITAMTCALAWKLDEVSTLAAPAVLRMAMIAAGAGAIWWSLLPTSDTALTRVFD